LIGEAEAEGFLHLGEGRLAERFDRLQRRQLGARLSVHPAGQRLPEERLLGPPARPEVRRHPKIIAVAGAPRVVAQPRPYPPDQILVHRFASPGREAESLGDRRLIPSQPASNSGHCGHRPGGTTTP
jgi:hypothetical protein